MHVILYAYFAVLVSCIRTTKKALIYVSICVEGGDKLVLCD